MTDEPTAAAAAIAQGVAEVIFGYLAESLESVVLGRDAEIAAARVRRDAAETPQQLLEAAIEEATAAGAQAMARTIAGALRDMATHAAAESE